MKTATITIPFPLTEKPTDTDRIEMDLDSMPQHVLDRLCAETLRMVRENIDKIRAAQHSEK